ncbi:AAA family ATPase [Corynebacterium sp.]|uniref:AAA family ATPase n=1 Tax=Corynebacterium sp. TaxID=1720 RepID=UPI003B3AA102
MRIKKIEVDGLFGYRDISLDFPDEPVVILSGVNGAGKSHVLKLLYALTSDDEMAAKGVEFKEARALFSDGSMRVISENRRDLELNEDIGKIEGKRLRNRHRQMGEGANGVSLFGRWKRRDEARFRVSARMQDGVRSSQTSSLYIDVNRLFPSDVAATEDVIEPSEIYISCINHFHRRGASVASGRQSQIQSSLTKQMIEGMAKRGPSASTLKKNFSYNRKAIERHKRFGFLKNEEVVDSEQAIEAADQGAPSLRRVFGIIYKNQKQVIDSCSKYVDRIELLLKILNRAYGETLKEINMADGDSMPVDYIPHGTPLAPTNNASYACVKFKDGDFIDPQLLSSGEKHLLALYVPLVLGLPERSFAFVDEPEISLHPAWQVEIVGNFRKAVEKFSGQVFVATHSPTVVNENWDAVVEVPIGQPQDNTVDDGFPSNDDIVWDLDDTFDREVD